MSQTNHEVSKQLFELIQKTEIVLRLYYNKNKWPSIFPTLAELAQLYREAYKVAPNALHSYLSFYFEEYSPTTNLVVKKCILVCMISEGQGYSSKIQQELLVACIASFICIKNENDKLQKGLPLSEQGKKLWKIRYQLAVKVLEHGGSINKQAARVLARLQPYCETLRSKNHTPLYDNTTLVVAIAQIVAFAIAKKGCRRNALSLTIKRLYLTNTDEFVRNSLYKMVEQFSLLPVGSSTNYEGDTAVLLLKNDQQVLCTIKDNKLTKLIKTQKPYKFEFNQIATTDKQLLYKVWSHIDLPSIGAKESNFDNTFAVIEKLNTGSFGSFRAIEKTIAPFPHIEEALTQAAKLYNREAQKGANIRHSLTMVGLNTATLLCQRVLIEQVISQLRHPFAQDVWHKYQQISLILATLINRAYGQEFESILSPISAVVAFMLKHHDIDIKRFTYTEKETDDAKPYSLSRLFGFPHFDEHKLQTYFESHFGDSPAHQAFQNSEREKHNSLSDDAKTFVAVKILAMFWNSASFEPTAWQKTVLEEQVLKFGWSDVAEVQEAILTLAMHSIIE
ncbi:hypothetical protein [Pseudoalteromonas luteoviolacea]|uniref:Uncharacterized protein n=1 Tax=Pseudoalteromonas luteoviolacea S4060-1 TaxID=1365257 RepID=A0A162CKD4_9GAMM|nr:hypothetical protein [Pseudoalteromonas luteoviolacea]KZN69374.1 hypothetical protein N478_12125 [Pseudoalteromonas luteoviolacea S4060-1]